MQEDNDKQYTNNIETDIEGVLSVDERLKILSEIAKDQSQKATDRVMACKEISNLLNDRIQTSSDGSTVTSISFKPCKAPKSPQKPTKAQLLAQKRREEKQKAKEEAIQIEKDKENSEDWEGAMEKEFKDNMGQFGKNEEIALFTDTQHIGAKPIITNTLPQHIGAVNKCNKELKELPLSLPNLITGEDDVEDILNMSDDDYDELFK